MSAGRIYDKIGKKARGPGHQITEQFQHQQEESSE